MDHYFAGMLVWSPFYGKVNTFKKIVDSDNFPPSLSHLKFLSQGSLACAYAKAATRNSVKKTEYCNLVFDYTKTLLEQKNTGDEVKALAFTARGIAYLNLSEYIKSIQAFECALELNNNALTLLGIGDAYSKMYKDDKAIEFYEKALKIAPANGYAAYKIGNLLIKTDKGKKDQAIIFYKRASFLSVARVALGKIYFDDGNFELALEEFRNATRISRKNSEAWVNIAWSILEKKEQPSEALIAECMNAARVSVQLDSGTPQEWHRRAILSLSLILTKKYDEAFEEANTSLSLAPNKSQAKYCIALCKFHLGQYEDSEKIVLEILKLNEPGIWKNKTLKLLKNIGNYIKKSDFL